MQRGFTIYFIGLAILTGIACTHGGALILLFLFFPLGFLAIAAPTILLYSLALVPMGVLSRTRRSRGLIAASALIPVALAILPGLLSQRVARDYAAQMGAGDFDRPAPSRPRSLELIGDASSGLWNHGHSVGDKAAWCNEACTRLLMNGELDWIRMTTLPERGRSKPPQSVVYRVEHRDVCPELPADRSVEKVLRDRLVAGDCLVSAPDNAAPSDATVKLTTTYARAFNGERPVDGLAGYAGIVSVKKLEIENRRVGRSVLVQTETTAQPLALPFYFGANLDMQCGNCNGPTIGRMTTVTAPIDVAQALRHSLGYSVAEIAAAPPEAPRQVSEGILALPRSAAPAFSKQQQDILNEALQAIAREPAPTDADVDFIRRVVSDDRVTEALVGISIQHMAQRNPPWLVSLIPTILDRMMAPIDQHVGHYKSALGWSLQNAPAEMLRPHRDQMIDIVTAQDDWTTSGILVHLAEVGGDDALSLVIRRLDANRAMGSQRQFAAVAACRAAPDAWPRLEPAVLAHLTPGRPNMIGDDEAALLLALVRFGEKSQAIDIVQKRGLKNGANVIDRLNRLEPDFDLKHCRDWL